MKHVAAFITFGILLSLVSARYVAAYDATFPQSALSSALSNDVRTHGQIFSKWAAMHRPLLSNSQSHTDICMHPMCMAYDKRAFALCLQGAASERSCLTPCSQLVQERNQQQTHDRHLVSGESNPF